MGRLLTIPHLRRHGMCPVNGIRDLVHWRSNRNWSNEFVYGLGLGGGFAYLRFKSADPPRQVYWGIATPRQHRYLAELLGAHYVEVENRSFEFPWKRVGAIAELAEAIRYNQLEDAASRFERIIEVEAEAYTELSKIVGAADLPTPG